MSDERTEVQVRLVCEEPGKHIETTTHARCRECEGQGWYKHKPCKVWFCGFHYGVHECAPPSRAKKEPTA